MRETVEQAQHEAGRTIFWSLIYILVGLALFAFGDSRFGAFLAGVLIAHAIHRAIWALHAYRNKATRGLSPGMSIAWRVPNGTIFTGTIVDKTWSDQMLEYRLEVLDHAGVKYVVWEHDLA